MIPLHWHGARQAFLRRARSISAPKSAFNRSPLVPQIRHALSGVATSTADWHAPGFNKETKQENGPGYLPWAKDKADNALLPPSLQTAEDDGFIFDGMTGGDVIHGMIVRHQVDHLCMQSETKPFYETVANS